MEVKCKDAEVIARVKPHSIMLAEFPVPQKIVSLGAKAILKRWKQDVQCTVGIKRAERLVQADAALSRKNSYNYMTFPFSQDSRWLKI